VIKVRTANKSRLTSSFLLITLITLSLVLVTTLYFVTAQTGTTVSGIISQDTTWISAGSPYVLTGNTLVNNGVTLTIQPGVTVNLGNYYIKVNGTLSAIGAPNNLINFNSGSIIFSSSCIGWNEQTELGCKIENCILNSTALSTSNTVKIDSDVINADLTVDSSTIISNSNIIGSISGGIVSGNSIIGDVSSLTIINNVINGSVSSIGVVTNNTIVGGVTATGNSVISNNRLSAAGNAVSVPSLFFSSGGQPIIANNTITNSAVGISISVFVRGWVGTNIPLVQNNVICKNGVGIAYGISLQESYYGPPTLIQNNTISQNQIGIELADSYECNLLIITFKAILIIAFIYKAAMSTRHIIGGEQLTRKQSTRQSMTLSMISNWVLALSFHF
jgi:parallel beta-helix repeat protein